MSALRGPPFLGVLMLDTRFPRLPGDIGHESSLSMPVRRVGVAGARPGRVVRDRPDPALLGPFVDAARALVDEGAAAISTSCGFLVHWQHELQAALPVPVWTSALLALPGLSRPGVLTVDAAALGTAALQAAGARPGTPVQGLAPGCHLQRVLLEDLPTLDPLQARADTVEAARRLVAGHPQVDAIVLECTNLPPHAAAIAQATGLPVHHLISLLERRWQALGTPT